MLSHHRVEIVKLKTINWYLHTYHLTIVNKLKKQINLSTTYQRVITKYYFILTIFHVETAQDLCESSDLTFVNTQPNKR